MLNPLLHTSNSAPTSPVCTRSIHDKRSAPNTTTTAILATTHALVTGHAPDHAHLPQRERRLSRLVKTRTLDFTEFPEGMREYGGNNNVLRLGKDAVSIKMAVRECRSQPGSPGAVPRIHVQDFGGVIAAPKDGVLGGRHRLARVAMVEVS